MRLPAFSTFVGRPGLYLVRRLKAPMVVHYGVLDVGNRLMLPQGSRVTMLVLHQTPPALRIEPWTPVAGWEVVARITDEPGAASRVREAMRNPFYDLFGNNCEHFAGFIERGVAKSPQLVFGGLIAVAVMLWFFSD